MIDATFVALALTLGGACSDDEPIASGGACRVSADCDVDAVCVAGACVAADGGGEGEGEGPTGEGEGEGEGPTGEGEGEGEGPTGEGEGEGEGEGPTGEGEGEGEPPPPPTATLLASASSLRVGLATTLRFSSTSATGCALEPGFGAVGTGGERVARPVVDTTYTLTCQGAGGATTTSTTTVTVAGCQTRCTALSSTQRLTCDNGTDLDLAAALRLGIGTDVKGVLFDVTVCDPTGFSFHLADAPSSDGFAGDADLSGQGGFAASCYDAELVQHGANLEGWRSDIGAGAAAFSLALPATGCTTFHAVVEDQLLEVYGPVDGAMSGASSFRLDPPDCGDAAQPDPPDRFWFFGFNRVVGLAGDPGGARTGTGLDRVEMCFR